MGGHWTVMVSRILSWLQESTNVIFDHSLATTTIKTPHCAKYSANRLLNCLGTQAKVFSKHTSEWPSTKLVKYESLRVSNSRVRVGSSSSKMVKCESNMRVYSTKYQYFQRRIPCDYWNSRVRVGSSSSKMVECESNMRVSKYSVIH